MQGLRRPPNSTLSNSNVNDLKSTLSGSNSAHGPRFKRYRVQAQGVKEVSDEVTMVEDEYDEIPKDEIFFSDLAPGFAIIDSGATRTLVGEEAWKKWVEKYDTQLLGNIKVHPQQRAFRFGGGELLQSELEMELQVLVKGQKLPLRVSVVPGPTPFLLARPVS